MTKHIGIIINNGTVHSPNEEKDRHSLSVLHNLVHQGPSSFSITANRGTFRTAAAAAADHEQILLAPTENGLTFPSDHDLKTSNGGMVVPAAVTANGQHHHTTQHHHHPPGPRSLRLQETDVVFGTKGNGRNQLFLKELEHQSRRYQVMSKADKMTLIQTIIKDWPGDFYVWSGSSCSRSTTSSRSSYSSSSSRKAGQGHDNDDGDDDIYDEKLTLIKTSSVSSSASRHANHQDCCPIRLYTSVRRMMNYVITKHKQHPEMIPKVRKQCSAAPSAAAVGRMTGIAVVQSVKARPTALTPTPSPIRTKKAKKIVSVGSVSAKKPIAEIQTMKKKKKMMMKTKTKKRTPKIAVQSAVSAQSYLGPHVTGATAAASATAAVSPSKPSPQQPFKVSPGTKKVQKQKAEKVLKRVVVIKKTKKKIVKRSNHVTSLMIHAYKAGSAPPSPPHLSTTSFEFGGGKAAATPTPSMKMAKVASAIVSPEPSPREIHDPFIGHRARIHGHRHAPRHHHHHHHQMGTDTAVSMPNLQPIGGIGSSWTSITPSVRGFLHHHGDGGGIVGSVSGIAGMMTTVTPPRLNNCVASAGAADDGGAMRSLEDAAISALVSFRNM